MKAEDKNVKMMEEQGTPGRDPDALYHSATNRHLLKTCILTKELLVLRHVDNLASYFEMPETSEI